MDNIWQASFLVVLVPTCVRISSWMKRSNPDDATAFCGLETKSEIGLGSPGRTYSLTPVNYLQICDREVGFPYFPIAAPNIA